MSAVTSMQGQGQGQINRKQVVRGIVFTLLINGVVPYVIYNLLLGHVSNIAALSIASIIPLLDNLLTLVRHRRLDVFGMFILLGFVLSFGTVLLGGDEKLILLRESFVTAIMSLVFLVSLLFKRPLIYHFALRFTVGNDPQAQATFASRWTIPYFRFVMRAMTTVWGLALLAEALIRTVLVYNLSVSAFLAISSVITYGIIGLTILWTVLYRKHSAKRLQQMIR